MFSPYTIGNSKSAIRLGTLLAECKDKRFRRRILRRMQKTYTNLKVYMDLPKPQRETAMWHYYMVTNTKAFYNCGLEFQLNGISFSLFDSTLKTAVRQALKKAEDMDKDIAAFELQELKQMARALGGELSFPEAKSFASELVEA